MHKISTIFERDSSFKIIDKPRDECKWVFNGSGRAIEKLDGTNVRVTVRHGFIVRLEARQNPPKVQKKRGVVDPWYRDAGGPGDQYLFDAIDNTDVSDWPDGEWSCEALGPKIQGNPLELEHHRLFGFSVPGMTNNYQYFNISISYQGFKEFFEYADSIYSPGHKPEGIVFHGKLGSMAKIKRKDF